MYIKSKLEKVFLGHLFLFMFFFFQIHLHATTYYVDSFNGSDSSSGNSISSPWKSIAKVNSFNFQPGDSILFKCGSVWREELIIPSGGSQDMYVTYSSYGSGNKPKILGSVNLTDWEEYAGNIWRTRFSQNGGWIWFVLDDTIQWGSKKENLEQLNDKYDFTTDSAYVYVFSKDNPVNEYKSIEISVRDFGIISGWYGNAKQNVLVENFEILFAKNAGIRVVGGENWAIKNCKSHHNGVTDESDGQGIQYEGVNGLFTNNVLYENGQHGFYLSAFGNYEVSNNIIESNTVYDNYHTGIDIMNNGDSLRFLNNTIIRYNRIFDNIDFKGKEVGIQLYGFNGGKVKNARIYYNILYNNRGIGISIQDNCDSIFIYNNTVYQPESTCFTLENNSGYVELINNIGEGDKYYAVLFVHNPANKIIDYNCWYRKSGNLIWMDGNYYEDLLLFSENTGFEKNGMNLNPMLNVLNFKLKINSPCIDKGKPLGLSRDYWGKEIINGKVDIGACECY